MSRPKLVDCPPVGLLSVYTARCQGGAGVGLERFLPSDRTTLYGYGRQALTDALRRLGIGAGDTVLLPGLICREVLASLSAVGAFPRFYDVDETLRSDAEALARAGTGGERAVVAVNYFGLPQPLEPFRAWCDARGAALIEDNAHGFLSCDGETPLGLRGDFGVFSLRKTLALPNGAALVDRRPGGHGAVGSGVFQRSPCAAERRYRAKAAMKGVMELGGVGCARTLVRVVRLIRRLLTGRALPAPSPDAETALPGEAFAPLAARLLSRLDVDRERARRRMLWEECRAMLSGVAAVVPLAEKLGEGVVPQGFPFLYMGTDAEAFISEWWRRGLPIQRWPALPRAIEREAPQHYRRIMLVPFLW